MSSKKVCIWLEPDLYEYLDEARGEELSVPQYIRLILKQKKKSSAKRKPKALQMDQILLHLQIFQQI